MNSFTSLFLLFVAFFGLVHSNQESANRLTDNVVAALNKQAHFDPLILPRHETNVSEWVGLVHVEGQFVLHYIKLLGLGAVSRVGDAAIHQEGSSTVYTAKLQLGGTNVKAFSSVSAYFGPHFHPEFRTESDIASLGTTFSVAVNANGTLSLRQFTLEEFRMVNFHLQGPFLPLDPVVDILADVLVNVFNGIARQVLSEKLQPIVEEELRNFKLNQTLYY